MSSAVASPPFEITYNGQFPTIVTERMRLEAISSEKYSKDLKQIFQNRDTMQKYDGAVFKDEELAETVNKWIEDWKNGPFGGFAMYTKNGCFVGYCGLTKSGEEGVAHLAYAVVPALRRFLYATEAAKALIFYATKLFKENVYLGNKHFYKVVATMRPDNSISAKVAKATGMSGPSRGPEGRDYFFYMVFSEAKV